MGGGKQIAKQVEETMGLLLESAQKEFLEKGFEKASMREIAGKAGVTTGALYVRFPNKDALFGALVEPALDWCRTISEEGNRQGLFALTQGNPEEMWSISSKMLDHMIAYIFQNREAFSLLVNHSAGSSYADFMDALVTEEEAETVMFMEMLRKTGYPVAQVTRADIRSLIRAQYYAVFEIIRHEVTQQEAHTRLHFISDFFQQGWNKIMGLQ